MLADIADARGRGARAIFLVDDNITLERRRASRRCARRSSTPGFNDIDYIVQAMTSSIANHGATLAPLMRQAGFRYVFLGIENILDDDLAFLRASAKNAQREGGRRVGNATLQRDRGPAPRTACYVVGGLIVGNPDDTRESIEANLAFARRYVDWPYIQHPTPYPGTPMTEDFRARGLIVNDRVEEYDGTTAVVRSEHLAADEIEFLRWRAERWMKVRHLPGVLRHYPGFVLRHGPRMLAHTFRGTTWRSVARAGERARRCSRATRRAAPPSASTCRLEIRSVRMSQLRRMFAVVALALVLAPLVASAPLFDPDEGLHAAIAQEMVQRGDYVTPTFRGEPFLDKPILFFWAEAASLRLFGHHAAAVRIPPLLFGLFGMITVALLGRAIFDESAGLVAGIVYGTMLLPMGVSEVAVHDIGLVPFMCLAALCLVRIEAPDPPKPVVSAFRRNFIHLTPSPPASRLAFRS